MILISQVIISQGLISQGLISQGLIIQELQKLWLLGTAPPDPAAPSHNITISFSYIIRATINGREMKKMTSQQIKFEKDQTGEIIAS